MNTYLSYRSSQRSNVHARAWGSGALEGRVLRTLRIRRAHVLRCPALPCLLKYVVRYHRTLVLQRWRGMYSHSLVYWLVGLGPSSLNVYKVVDVRTAIVRT